MLRYDMEAKHILVIGGGVAGLAAAIELGAEFVHGGSDAFWKLIRSARLKTVRVPNRFRRLQNGTFQKMDLWQEVGKVMERIDTCAADKSFTRFLAGQRVSAETRTLVTNFIEGFDAADPKKIGVHGLAAGEEEDDDPGEHQFRLRHGYSGLVDFLARTARRLGVRIKTNTVVRSIDWQVNHVKAIGRQNNARSTFEADAAIIALPLGVLKAGRFRFKPALPDKENAIARLPFGNVIKVVLQFKNVFWPGKNFGFIVAPDLPIPTWWSDSRGPVLTGWVGGPKADALSRQPAASLERIAVATLARVLKMDAALIRSRLSKIHTHDWRKDPFIGGAYSYVPVNGSELPTRLAAPVDNTLYFAGEATVSDSQPGTVHGAFGSGRRAAKEFLAAHDSN